MGGRPCWKARAVGAVAAGEPTGHAQWRWGGARHSAAAGIVKGKRRTACREEVPSAALWFPCVSVSWGCCKTALSLAAYSNTNPGLTVWGAELGRGLTGLNSGFGRVVGSDCPPPAGPPFLLRPPDPPASWCEGTLQERSWDIDSIYRCDARLLTVLICPGCHEQVAVVGVCALEARFCSDRVRSGSFWSNASCSRGGFLSGQELDRSKDLKAS